MNDPFACPAPGCDVFPYDTAHALAAHLVSAHAGAPPAATPTRFSAPKGATPGRQAPVKVLAGVSSAAEPIENRRDEVRVSDWPGTFASTPAPRHTPTANPASERQVSYLRSLLAQHPDVDAPDLTTIDKRSASALIDELRNRPTIATPTPTPARADVPEGFHVHDGTVYKVQTSKTGNTYAKVLVLPADPEENAAWEYVGKRPFRHLSEDTVATLETAQAFGLRTTHCMCCGRHLEVKESVERGIGPICLAKYF